MAAIQWSDSLGVTHTFSNTLPSPGSRFSGWTPNIVDIEDRHAALGNGLEVAFVYRTDATAKFEIRQVPFSQHATYFLLQRWLLAGGAVTVVTNDRAARTYTCVVNPGTKPTFTQSDAAQMLYTASFELATTNGALMLCDY